MMSILDLIQSLPETVPSMELQQYFEKLIQESKYDTLRGKELFTDILFELSDKQWHNYEKVSPELRDKLDSIITGLLCQELSLHLIQNISGLIGRLGLSASYEVYKSLARISDNIDTSVFEEMQKTINEYGASVENPYR